ncbi:hypothetical protein [Kitasatospora sp. NPDC057223]|uniref:DUF7927 domain-containing protein n=1 Tax=Kitasatospora sp. NPDC057223 TaxID=3346055 RepID=UPI00364044F5
MTARPAWKPRNAPRTAAAVTGSALLALGMSVPAGAAAVGPLGVAAVPGGCPATPEHTAEGEITAALRGVSNPACGPAPARVDAPAAGPDLKVGKSASAVSAAPGDLVGYTITVENTGSTPSSGATLVDDLTEDLDDASYGWDLRADRGTFSYTGPKVRWQGTLAAGEKATVTYSVKVRAAGSGDGAMRNGVVVAGGRSNCGPGSEDPACRVLTTVSAAPVGTASPSPSAEPSPSPEPSPTPTATPSPAATASATAARPSADPAPEPPAPGGDAVAPPPATAIPSPTTATATATATAAPSGAPVAGTLPGTGAGRWLPALAGAAAVLLSVGALLVLRTRRR